MNSDENKTEGAYDLSVTSPSTSNHLTTNTNTSTQSVLNNIKVESEERDRNGPIRLGSESNHEQQSSRHLLQNGSSSSLSAVKRMKHHSLVSAMMEDKSRGDDSPYYMPLRPSDKDQMDFDEGKSLPSSIYRHLTKKSFL